MISQNDLNQLSRRKWLRDTAIAATSITVVPSFFIGCSDHRIPPTVGVGAPGVGVGAPRIDPTPQQLANAAKNISNMIVWLAYLHTLQDNYEDNMLDLIKSGEKPSGWADFITNIFLAIVAGILTAAAAAAELASFGVASAGVVALYAVTAEVVKKFAFGDGPPTLYGVFAEFKTGQDRLYEAMTDRLLILADKTNNYQNLRDKWTEEIEFNGKKHTCQDFAIEGAFPSEEFGTAFVALKDAALGEFKKYFWNVMIVKAGSLEYSYEWPITVGYEGQSPTHYGRDEHYKNYPATYLRGSYGGIFTYYYRYWHFTFDGGELPAAAAKELFKDDTPGNIINPDGLFNRDYVFKQFRGEKPRFFGYHDLKKHPYIHPRFLTELDFDLPDDYEFTRGMLGLK